ncbi:hypothetical protein M8C13_01615 [Crossiella sp. SN42]|uniref:hypothetical protein n=1 Tax=Crossiella sp. SN42 TaxID=2944808 RepID=UPI00207C8A27|nr:hypothetical protein [Crossiella sp. SN42]MCO1574454.1 hypothetical protein [Crossiella sp. SN42]
MHVLAASLECDGLAVRHTEPGAEVPVPEVLLESLRRNVLGEPRPPTAEVRRRGGQPIAVPRAVPATGGFGRPGRTDLLGYQVEPPGPG